MSVQWPQESEYAKEMVKHEAYPTALGPGLRPYVYREFPMAIYKATRDADGRISFENQEVPSEQQLSNMRSRGWAPDPEAALKELDAATLETAKLAANLEYQKTVMSPRAAAEIDAAQAEHSGHLPSVPETPIAPRRKL